MSSTSSTKFDLLISGGEVLLRQSSGQWTLEKQDIGIKAGRIEAVGSLSGQPAAKTFQAKGLQVLPGLIDTQVHFREPGLEHKEDLASGTRAALLGGITGVFEMPNTKPPTATALDLADKMGRAHNRCWTNYAFYVGASADNISKLASLEQLPGCCGIKIFMGSSTGTLLVADDHHLRQVLQQGRRRIAVHCEDDQRLTERATLVKNAPGSVHLHPEWRDVETALRATQRIVKLSQETKRPLHILHVTTAEELALLKNHKDLCTVECTPQHLTLTAPECYEKLGTFAQMNPPIRDRRHQEALWQAVASGVVDVLGSDHAPHTIEEKRQTYPLSPAGMPGVQTILPVMLNHVHQGRLSLGRVVELLATNPARIWGLDGYGEIRPGGLANLTVIDQRRQVEITNDWIASKCKWTPFAGMKVTGWPTATIINGFVAMRDGEILGSPAGQPLNLSI